MTTRHDLHMPFGLENPWLAPLAGFSDLPFRLLCREHGAAAAVTEMVSAKGLVYESPGTEPLLDTCPADTPLAVQLFGAEEEFMERAAAMVLDRGFTNLDLNAGCSVRKVIKTGAGAALLSDPVKLAALARVMVRRAGPGCVGVKLRLGLRQDEETFIDCTLRLQDVGVAWLTLHPRYAAQGFSGRSDRSALARLVDTIDIPVIASGDLVTSVDAFSCVQETGAAGVMFARGALKDPAIFSRLQDLVAEREPADRTPREIIALVSRHAELCRLHARDEEASLKKMRTVVPRYVKGMPGASKLRNALVRVSSWQGLADIMQRLEMGNC